MRWNVPGIGPWGYDTRVPLRKVDDEWKVHWRVTVVHPRLRDTERLGTTRELPAARPSATAPAGRSSQLRPVKRVGAVVGEVGDPRATATGLARVLGVDAGPILSQLRGGGPQQFVEAIVLREDDYAALQGRARLGARRHDPRRNRPARAHQGVRQGGARHGRARHGRAARAAGSALRARRPGRPVGAPGPLRAPPRRHARPPHRDAQRRGRRLRDPVRARRPRRAGRPHHARQAGPAGGRAGPGRAAPTRPPWWPWTRAPATCSPWPTARPSRASTAPSRAATRPAPRSRS